MDCCPRTTRGSSLLLAHCGALARERETAYERLEDEVGGDLARLLVFALSGDHGRRGPSSP
ncbi:MAG TPA: hypothetical protein VF094_13325 [Gaiellaceae bacterium]